MSWAWPSPSAGRPASGRSSPPFSRWPLRRTRSRGARACSRSIRFGLGLPFLLAALAMEPFVHFLKRFKAHFGKVERIVGVLLVVTGRDVPDRRHPERQLLAAPDLSRPRQSGLTERGRRDRPPRVMPEVDFLWLIKNLLRRNLALFIELDIGDLAVRALAPFVDDIIGAGDVALGVEGQVADDGLERAVFVQRLGHGDRIGRLGPFRCPA